MKGWATIFIMLLLTGCATSTTVWVDTDPPGGQVTVEETGDVVDDGESVDLQPGRYRFSSEAEGYRGDALTREIPRGGEQRITVPLGMGFAPVEIRALPTDADIDIGGEHQGQGRISTELNAGVHAVEVSLEGYDTHREQLRIEPGRPVSRLIQLEAIPEAPTHGQVTVTPEPQSARVIFQDQDLGAGAHALGPLLPGTYSVWGIKSINDRQRLTGEVDFTIEAGERRTVTLSLDRQERRFQGEWLSEAEALRREQRRYRQHRTQRPLAVQMDHAGTVIEQLRQRDDLAQALMAMLRVGDRVTLKAASQRWQIWKRHSEWTPDFEASVAALQAGEPYSPPWADDPVQTLRVEPSADPLATMIMALHRARAPNPLLDLHADQFSEDSITVSRNRSDGELTVLLHGGEDLTLSEGGLRTFGDVHFDTVPAGHASIDLRWGQVPERVLIISDRSGPIREMGAPDPLLLEQQRWLSLAPGLAVTRLLRLSYGPEYSGWSHRVTQREGGPVDFQLDLTGDHIGPHEMPGDYQRVWVLEYEQGGTRSQRQVQIRYRVLRDAEDGGLDEFIRRVD